MNSTTVQKALKDTKFPEKFQQNLAVRHLLLGCLFDLEINTFTSFQFLFQYDQQFDTINDHLDQFNFREADTVSIGDIKGSISGGSIDTTGTTLLQTKLGKKWDFDVDTSADTGSEVGWAGQ